MPSTAIFRAPGRPAPRWHMIAEIELTPWVVERAAWLQLCDQLEAIADALPHCPGLAERNDIAAQIETLLFTPKEGEEAGASSPLLVGGLDTPLARAVLAHLGSLRAVRAAQAQDILDALDGDPARQPDLIGYMLRCFFEGCRHLVTIEQLALLALGANRLLPGARALLTERLIGSCAG